MNFGRLVTAMVTPFTASGDVDTRAIERLVDHLVETGTTGIVACGTTGESPVLSHEEKLTVFETTIRAAAGRVPVIAGTGSNNTKDSIALSREAEALGVDGLLLVAPYYNRPTQEGLYQHFASIAEVVELPVMLYNIPGRSSVNIQPETVLELAKIPNIIALKEASADFTHILYIAAGKPDDFLLYSGDDKMTLPMLSIGAYGVVSVASHVVGPEMTAMMDAHFAGDVRGAAAWAGRLLPMFESLFKVSSPAPLKAALNLLGIEVGGVRLPLVDAPASLVDLLKDELDRLGKR